MRECGDSTEIALNMSIFAKCYRQVSRSDGRDGRMFEYFIAKLLVSPKPKVGWVFHQFSPVISNAFALNRIFTRRLRHIIDESKSDKSQRGANATQIFFSTYTHSLSLLNTQIVDVFLLVRSFSHPNTLFFPHAQNTIKTPISIQNISIQNISSRNKNVSQMIFKLALTFVSHLKINPEMFLICKNSIIIIWCILNSLASKLKCAHNNYENLHAFFSNLLMKQVVC